MLDSPNAEPSALQAALESEAASAHSITIHLRAVPPPPFKTRTSDPLRKSIGTKLNPGDGQHALKSLPSRWR